jgi:aminomethyltransferase
MLSLQGPRVKAVLKIILGDINKLPEPARNNLTIVKIFGTKVPIARTGYTGEPICFELFPPAETAEHLWNKLLEFGKSEGIAPVGLGARDTLRLEAGLPLYSHELGSDSKGEEIPVFALPTARFAVSFSKIKGEFIGREALMQQFEEIKQREEGQLDTLKEKLLVPKVIMPMAIPDGRVARAGYPVYMNEKLVGTVTSGTMVSYWKMRGAGLKSKPGTESSRRAICLAYLDADLKEDQRIKVVIKNKITDGVIVDRHMGSEAPPYARPLLVEE